LVSKVSAPIAERSSSAFLDLYPSYATTRALDELRAAEYPALNAHVYLDYTAANVYAQSQLDRHRTLLCEHLFGNPHSTNPASSRSAQFVERARRAVLAFFRASPDEWEVVFTANGQVKALRVVRGLGHGLDEAALRAAEQIKFKPAQREGHAVDSMAVLHVIFQMA